MHELVSKALHWTGIKGEEYDISKPQYAGEKDPIYFTVCKGDKFKETAGPFSPLHVKSEIGAKRFRGEWEWITGINSVLEGFAIGISGGQLFPGLCFVVLGILLTRDGKERRDIAWSIIDKFNKK